MSETEAASPLFHLLTKTAWDEAKRSGEYRPASLASEGFIHLSTREQVEGTLRRHFAGVSDLLLLTLDRERLQSPVRFEDTAGHGVYPHLYGPLNLDAVTEVKQIRQAKFKAVASG